LVGGGYGIAPMFALADTIAVAGGKAHFVLGAGSADRLFGVVEARRRGGTVVVTTDDGSAGTRGLVTDVLPELLMSTGATTVYACGPMGMLAAAQRVAAATGASCQVLVEESMACGIGVCMTCVLPIIGADGVTRMTRACTDGPVFDGTAVRFADVGSVPADTFGAPNLHAGGS
jgi:dihydroorotate dehydrogenase electron transfer subunit